MTQDDWSRANGWEIPSLVRASLDAGLRPIEVGRATVQWVDVDDAVLRIPKSESSKNRDDWIVGISTRTRDKAGREVTLRVTNLLYSWIYGYSFRLRRMKW